ncbi:MAG TPA: serine hydrolase domain-containing protein [Acidobacteriaceae bacterium]|jgi:CubicO group peptidase (beta-lactamase class C family)|nr:serine hydrolase domain-containing protein [Acidobacteriaceae bacterium]
MKLLLIPAALLIAVPLFSQTAQTPSPLDGIWLGTLHTPGPALRVQFHLHQDATGKWTCSGDSIDQGAMGIPCTVTSATNPIAIEVPAINGKFSATLTGDSLSGSWSQGPGSLPLALTRQATALASAVPLPLPPDPAIPAVSVDQLKPVLDKDLAAALDHGALAPATHGGVTIGVYQHGVRRIFSYGTAHDDSLFEIGSITKTFTATILAQMVAQNKAVLTEPVRNLLPPGTVTKPSGPEITLLDLSDQHSGLPRMPNNFAPANPANPYADYDPKLLYAFIAKHGVALPPNAPFLYSNLGVGLLGQALSNRAGVSYPTLLHDEVTGPLHMTDTVIAIPPALESRFIQGYDAEHHPAHAWDLDALAGAGAIRSTAADMLTFLEAQLHPDHLPAADLATPDGKTLSAAIAATHVIHAEVGQGMHIALNWFHIDSSDTFWHNGGTGGYSAFAAFNPTNDFAIVVLSNTSPGNGSITDALGGHIAARLMGKPAVSLAPAK